MLSIQEAQNKILAEIHRRDPEVSAVQYAYNRVLAETIFSPLNLPPFTNSAMDGFAVYSRDIKNASPSSPVRLPVSMDIPAGFGELGLLKPGTAARILTGAPMPTGADAVLPVEDTDQFEANQSKILPEFALFYKAVKIGENTRPAGEDLVKGQQVFEAGRFLHAQDVGLLVSMGIREVKLFPRPHFAIFSSGDELLAPGQPLTPGKIYDSNTYILTGLLEKAGALVTNLGVARDDPQSVIDTLDKAAATPPDVIISSAGVSVGVFDYVRQVIEENGKLNFWRVNMRPGKPLAFGSYKNIPFLGLPGNPVSAYIGCLVFALPIIRYLQGLPAMHDFYDKAILTDPLFSKDGRESYYRGIITVENGITRASLTGHQGSGNLFSLVQANALLIVPAGVKSIPAGEEISFWPLDK